VKVIEGMIPFHTLDSDIDFARSEAKTIYGNLGIKVWICRANIKTKSRIQIILLQPKIAK